METYFLHYTNEAVLTIQPKQYIEDGWYIKIIDTAISLWEIPANGGKANMIGFFETIQEAIEAAKNLI